MRNRAEWVYLADRAPQVAQLTVGQHGYAISLRRVLAQSLATQATRRAVLNPTPEGKEWSGIARACRNEVRRMDRADKRLAARIASGVLS